MTEFIETPESSPERLVLAGIIAGAGADQVLSCFTSADAITAWWSESAEVEARVGGDLIARWDTEGWTMRGRFTELVAGQRVAFTWSWDHETDVAERLVEVEVEPDAAGTRLQLRHGPFESAEAEDRANHLHGWLHFLPRLAALFEPGN